MLSWWFGIHPGTEGDIQRVHGGQSGFGPRWGWVSRYIRICFSARRQHCRKILKTFCWRYGWMQEFDMTNASYAQQPAAFDSMVQQFRADLAGLAAQCHGGSPASVPRICGDTTCAWKQEHGTQYEVVYGAYKQKNPSRFILFPFMTDGGGVNGTNNPSEDPDIAGSGYYGSASRTNKTGYHQIAVDAFPAHGRVVALFPIVWQLLF